MSSCIDNSSDLSVTLASGYCITGTSGFDNIAISLYSSTYGSVTCGSGQCMNPNNAVCVPVSYDSDTAQTSMCSAIWGDTYCCEVPAIDGENEYSDISYGTCQTID
eukprot:CAMPEP_0170554086 /NCGR_PEP_ID=MMETSP0211-20121228/11956_1 /TAXON_ID=311385 /ORGANISM="Pseudokeronopsis sp., Strain OXSARD2" /LENGTH=105 /DNA_ID=CAMNT_0010862911 /DNA_START=137 /DNA_END=454 /DNA_ORIENTATION=+